MPVCALLSKTHTCQFFSHWWSNPTPNSSLSGLRTPTPLTNVLLHFIFYNHSVVCRLTEPCVGSDKQIASPFRSVFPLCAVARGTLNYQLQTEAQLTTKPHTGGTAKQQQLETGARFTMAWRVPRRTATRLRTNKLHCARARLKHALVTFAKELQRWQL